MRRILRVLPAAAAAALLAATAARAHHSFTQFDRETQRVMTGEVVRWAFNNPHSWLYLNIPDDSGEVTLWSFEASAPVGLLGRGIDGRTFEPGDTVTFMFCPLKDGRPGGHIGWARLEDGSFINPSDGGCHGDDDTIARWQGWLEQGYTSNTEASGAD